MYIGSTWRNFAAKKGGEFAIRMVYEITERTTDANGQEMLLPETEIDMYWTSLGVSDEEVISLYHNHAVCEQYHSEIKTDMGVERLPSGKFETNALILKLTMIAYNILRIIGTAAMKEGCTWRAIPHDFPKWQNVRYHYDIWAKEDEDGISPLDRIFRKLVEMERKNNGRETQTTMVIVDSKSI